MTLYLTRQRPEVETRELIAIDLEGRSLWVLDLGISENWPRLAVSHKAVYCMRDREVCRIEDGRIAWRVQTDELLHDAIVDSAEGVYVGTRGGEQFGLLAFAADGSPVFRLPSSSYQPQSYQPLAIDVWGRLLALGRSLTRTTLVAVV